jgi:hypothetical protein
MPEYLSGNPCQLAVDHLIGLNDAHAIYCPEALCNANETMVRHVIDQIDRYAYATVGAKNELVVEWACNHPDRIRMDTLLENPLIFVRDTERKKFMCQ